MKVGKLAALGVLGFLGWQHQDMLSGRLDFVLGVPTLMNTHVEMRTYQVALLQERERNRGRLPGDPIAWIRAHYHTKDGKPPDEDYFGERYRTSRTARAGDLDLRSCGPDRSCGTKDDILKALYPR